MNIKQKINKFLNEDTAASGLVGVAITVLVLVAIFMVIPMIGDRLETSTQLTGWANESNHSEGGNQWNSTVNTDVINGRSLWEDNGTLIALAVSVMIIGIVIGYVIDLGGIRTGGGGGQ